jgi:hypothetical protein
LLYLGTGIREEMPFIGNIMAEIDNDRDAGEIRHSDREV